MKKVKGFTIIEIVIVVSIIGILALIVSPNYIKNIRYARQQEALNLGRQICLCIVNSEIANEEDTKKNEKDVKENVVNEINNFTKANVSKNDISIENTENICVNYEKYNNKYKAVVNMFNCKYKIYLTDGKNKQLLYDDYEM